VLQAFQPLVSRSRHDMLDMFIAATFFAKSIVTISLPSQNKVSQVNSRRFRGLLYYRIHREQDLNGTWKFIGPTPNCFISLEKCYEQIDFCYDQGWQKWLLHKPDA
jgi:hypothetical protein